MAKLNVFMSHIHEEEAVAQFLKSRIEETFLGQVDIFVASDAKSIEPGHDWFEKIMEGIRAAKVLLILTSGESAPRPWINFEAGAGWMGGKRVIPLCHRGMVPPALPEALRRLQAVDMTEPAKVADLLSLLAREADLNVPPDLPAEEIAGRFREGAPAVQPREAAVPAQPGFDETLFAWLRRPGAHVGEEIEVTARLGDVTSPNVRVARAAGLDTATALRVVLHTHEEDYRPYIECMADGAVADTVDGLPRDTWGKAKLRVAATYELPSPVGVEATRLVPLVVIQSFARTQSPVGR